MLGLSLGLRLSLGHKLGFERGPRLRPGLRLAVVNCKYTVKQDNFLLRRATVSRR